MKINTIKHSEEIWSINNALDVDTCNICIQAAEQNNLFPNDIILEKDGNNFLNRNKYRLFLNSSELAEIIWQNIADYVPKTHLHYAVSGLNQAFRFYKYYPHRSLKNIRILLLKLILMKKVFTLY